MSTILIVTISFRPNIGGVETHLDNLCDYLAKNGYRVYVITYQPITTKVLGKYIEKNCNMVIHRIPWFGHGFFHKIEPYPLLEFVYLTPMLLVYSLFFMFRHGKEIDLIHAHGLNAASVAKVLAKIFKKRYVVSIHAVYNLGTRPLLAKTFRMVLSSADTVLAASKKTREDLLISGLPKNKVKVFIHWVNQDLFRPLDKLSCKRELKLEDKFLVLFVGRLIKKKGVRSLLDVASKIDLDDVTFAFIGDGPLANEVKRASTIQRNVMFIGKVTEEKMVKYYNAVEIVVVPSLYEEPFGRVIIEALSCGVPVIASNKGGIAEVLNSDIGILVSDIAKISEEIKDLYENPRKLLEMARNCREYSEFYYSEKNAKIIEKAYRSRLDVQNAKK